MSAFDLLISAFQHFSFSAFAFKFPCPVKCEANYFTGDWPVECALGLWNLLGL